jgi:A/G-specific adenine glycosylase
VARKTGRTAELPAPRTRKPLPLKRTTWFVFLHDGRVLLERRPSPGIWGGLWCFPEREILKGGRRRPLAVIEHGFSHFRLRIQPFLRDAKSADKGHGMWLEIDAALGAAVPTPVKQLLKRLRAAAV